MPSFLPSCKFKNVTPGVKFWSSNLTGNIKIFQKCKIYTNHSNQNILGGTKSEGVNFSAYQNVSICNGYRVFDIFRIGVKFSRWGKNSLGEIKIHQLGTSETVRYVRSSPWHLQFNLCVLVYLRLCYTWPWKDEQKYRLIFLLVFCGISSCLARIWQQQQFLLYSERTVMIYRKLKT